MLLCVGVRAETGLARSAGLEIGRGVVVDAQMRTSNPDIYCVGDAAELPGALGGLWSIGSEQGKIAAGAILGGDARYAAQALPPVQLKVGGIDLKSFGSFDVEAESLTEGDVNRHVWKHLRIRDGRLVGGVFVNAPQAAAAAIHASRTADGPLAASAIRDILTRD